MQQVVLNHVAQLTGLIEVAPAALDADFLGNRDFHVGNMVLVPLGLEQAVGETQGNEVLHRVLAQIVVDAVDAVFREELRNGVVDPARRGQVVTDRLFQHRSRALGEVHRREVFANRTVHRGRGREIGDQGLRIANALGQRNIVLGLEEIDVQVAETRQKALGIFCLELRFGNEATHGFFDVRQMRLFVAWFTRQGKNSSVFMQQSSAIELIKSREQLAYRQVPQGTKQGKCARFNRNQGHNVGSFIKLGYKYLF